MATGFGIMQFVPLALLGPGVTVWPFAAGLAASNPVAWFDLIPTLMS